MYLLKTKLRHLDWTIIFIIACFSIISTALIYSATNGTRYAGLHINNLVFYIVLFLPMIAMSLLDYRWVMSKFSYIFYGLGIALLLYVRFFGLNLNGAQRWIDLKFMQFQPSEVVKLFVIFVLAYWFGRRKGQPLRFWQDIVPGLLLTGLPFYLVLKQPDLGSALIFIAILIGMLWVANIRLLHVLWGAIVGAAAVASVAALYFYNQEWFFKIIRPHQWKRIQTFLDPASDPDATWHVLNSIAAVGTGQMTGKGFLQGTFVQNGFIPYHYADSIYVVIGEEFGFIGSAVLLLLYFMLIYRMVRIAIDCVDPAGAYIIAGLVSMLTLQIFENIAMHTGMMPLTGIALPFISYGGSSLLTNMLAIGIVLNIKVHQQMPDTREDQPLTVGG
ncbi:FtsW/RodA/SpoVE family cell cycle protein [Paenibacillus senegalensis]|uniref:FtsW/RodA/SpoVE family cell cycle protein n=1 Tax=Paenibacillus senegalensis TaxID=1465766 RepID=UPI0002880155|nr:FtsW/RodA/SpoVE family cell cycle protein [Paenibacillus senegalensis]